VVNRNGADRKKRERGILFARGQCANDTKVNKGITKALERAQRVKRDADLRYIEKVVFCYELWGGEHIKKTKNQK